LEQLRASIPKKITSKENELTQLYVDVEKRLADIFETSPPLEDDVKNAGLSRAKEMCRERWDRHRSELLTAERNARIKKQQKREKAEKAKLEMLHQQQDDTLDGVLSKREEKLVSDYGLKRAEEADDSAAADASPADEIAALQKSIADQ